MAIKVDFLFLFVVAIVPLLCNACLNQLYPDEGGTRLISDITVDDQNSVNYVENNQAKAPAGARAIKSTNVRQKMVGKAKKVCYTDGICFSNDQPPYTGLPLPVPPVGMPLRYYLYTPESPVIEDLPVTGESELFLDDRPFKIFIHGFGMNSAHVMSIELARKLVYQCECNVMVVDWRGGSFGGPTSDIGAENYESRAQNAFSNTRVVARMLGRFLHRFYERRDTLLPKDALHCIGVDLGAHICAQLQDSFHDVVNRISGLNPTVPNGCGKSCLDPTDAVQVDVIHTTRAGVLSSEADSIVQLGDLGADVAVGHMDFYVNWDQPLQPKCEKTDKKMPYRCASRRALQLFINSIGKSCQYKARSCDNPPWNDCQACTAPTGSCVTMGYGADKSLLNDLTVNKFNGIFLVDTTKYEPFCGLDD